MGDSIAFVHLRVDATDQRANGIYMIGADGGGLRLVWRGFVRSIDWSPDGRRLVFANNDGLASCTPLGDSVITIVRGAAYFPSWSPGNDAIAYDDISYVWTISAVGGTPSQVIAGRDPDWSPDGSALVVVTGFPGGTSGEVATVSLNGDVLGRLTFDGNEDRSPSWSPADASIAWNLWAKDQTGRVHPEFWISDTARVSAHRLVAGEGDVAWSPDGSQLALSIQTSAGGKLFIIPASGGVPRQLTY